jgi:hypothetical protein
LFPVTDAVDFASSLFLHTIKLSQVRRSVLCNKAIESYKGARHDAARLAG